MNVYSEEPSYAELSVVYSWRDSKGLLEEVTKHPDEYAVYAGDIEEAAEFLRRAASIVKQRKD